MRTWILNLELIDSPILMWSGIVSVALLVVALWVKPRRPLRALIGAAIGAALLSTGTLIMQGMNLFDGPLPDGTAGWIVFGGASMGAAVTAMFTKRWWRIVIAVVAMLSAAATMGLAVNKTYGVTHTLATILGINALRQIQVPSKLEDSLASNLKTWQPPSDMPSKGRVGALIGTLEIQPSKPYKPRPASLYLPPAALTKNPPKLPVVVLMMGQPGSPDPSQLAKAFDEYAAGHKGLAPIGVVVDQLAGAPTNNPTCIDSEKYGAVSTYINVDVPKYIKRTLNVQAGAGSWAIAGYSNGGSCALQFATEFPKTWGVLVDISGNPYPGSEVRAATLKELWKGDEKAYEAWQPKGQIGRNPGAYNGHFAIVTWGSQDVRYGPTQRAVADMLEKAGFQVQRREIFGASHTGPAYRVAMGDVPNDLGPWWGLGASRSELPSVKNTPPPAFMPVFPKPYWPAGLQDGKTTAAKPPLIG